MKKILSLLVLFPLMLCASNLPSTEKEIPSRMSKDLYWESDMDTAFKRAAQERKNVMVMVEEPGCKWCVKMKKGALSDAHTQIKLQNYILLKVQRSDTPSIKQLEGFTHAIPSFHFMTPDRQTIETVIGFYQTEDFLHFLDEIEADQ